MLRVILCYGNTVTVSMVAAALPVTPGPRQAVDIALYTLYTQAVTNNVTLSIGATTAPPHHSTNHHRHHHLQLKAAVPVPSGSSNGSKLWQQQQQPPGVLLILRNQYFIASVTSCGRLLPACLLACLSISDRERGEADHSVLAVGG